MSKPKNAKSPWQPIWEAPKDGTHILVQHKDGTVEEMWAEKVYAGMGEDRLYWFTRRGRHGSDIGNSRCWMLIPPLPEGER